MRGFGCIARPAFPAPSVFFGRNVLANLGHIVPRERGVISGCMSLRGATRRSNPLLLRGNMDCFASLAMTVSRRAGVARLERAIQYSKDASDGIEKPRRTRYRACAGHDRLIQREMSSETRNAYQHFPCEALPS